MAAFGEINGEEPTTVTFKLATVTQTWNSTVRHQEIVTLGGSESTLAIAQVRATDPASTEWALTVRQVGFVANSTIVTVSTGSVRVHQSTAADLNVTVAGYVAPSTIVTVSTGSVRVHQSTAADLNVTVAGYVAPSTTVTVNGNQSSNSSVYLPVRLTNGTAFLTPSQDYTDGSSGHTNISGPAIAFDNGSNATMRIVSLTNGFPVNIVAGSAAGSTLVTVRQSTVGDLRAAVYQSTAADLVTTARLQTSSGGNIGSTAPLAVFLADSTGQALGASTHYNTSNCQQYAPLVRPIIPICNSTTIVITSTHSTAIYPLISSVASLRHKVFAYFIGSTHTNPSTLIFCSSLSNSGFDHWHVNFGSGSSGITGANLALPPPGFIFAGISQNALNVKIEGGSSVTSTVVARISIAWFDEA